MVILLKTRVNKFLRDFYFTTKNFNYRKQRDNRNAIM
jgi:hypothetical protein